MHKKYRLDVLQRLVNKHGVDVAMLTESPLPPAAVLGALNSEVTRYHFNEGRCERIAMFSTRPTRFIQPVLESDYLTARRLIIPAKPDILLVVVHLPSVLNRSDASHEFDCREAADIVRECEERLGHRRTIVVGDFNMDPFDSVMVAASGFHAIMDRRIVQGGSRMVAGKERHFFYNPMWSFFGDVSRGPPGTYYRAKSEHVSYFWHMLDQILVRQELLEVFSADDLHILTNDGQSDFLKSNGTPDPNQGSDHLPLLFKLDV